MGPERLQSDCLIRRQEYRKKCRGNPGWQEVPTDSLADPRTCFSGRRTQAHGDAVLVGDGVDIPYPLVLEGDGLLENYRGPFGTAVLTMVMVIDKAGQGHVTDAKTVKIQLICCQKWSGLQAK